LSNPAIYILDAIFFNLGSKLLRRLSNDALSPFLADRINNNVRIS